mgnify:CR=1 FL=1
MKQLTELTDEELVNLAQKTLIKYQKSIEEARKISSEYGFKLDDSYNDIINTIFVHLKQQREKAKVESIEHIYQNALVQLSKRGDYTQIQELITLFQDGKVQKIKSKLKSLRLYQEKPNKRNSSTGEKSPKSCLRVTFPNGKIICNSKNAETLCQVIDKIGPKKVANLGLQVSSQPLVSRKKHERSQNEISKGWLVTTHSSTLLKKHQIEQISEALGLGLVVELVDKDLL